MSCATCHIMAHINIADLMARSRVDQQINIKWLHTIQQRYVATAEASETTNDAQNIRILSRMDSHQNVISRKLYCYEGTTSISNQSA